MAALTLTLKSNPTFKLDCRRLTPNGLANLSMAEIENLNLVNAKNSPKVADYFEVSGMDTNHIMFKNANHQLDYIGHKMTHGQIIVEGDCGDFVGSNKRGGTIICHGNANDRVGDSMRRGLILIDGNTGDYCGSRMIAGTIGVYGNVGCYVGFGMQRGTILLKNKPEIHVTIQDYGTHNLSFLALLFKSFKTLPTKFNQVKTNRVQRFVGDLACNGNGELLVLVP